MCRLLLLASIIYETTEVWKEFCTVHLLLCGSLWADSSLTNTSTISTYSWLHLHLMATLQSSDYEKSVINIFTQFAYMSQTPPNLKSYNCLHDKDTNAGGPWVVPKLGGQRATAGGSVNDQGRNTERNRINMIYVGELFQLQLSACQKKLRTARVEGKMWYSRVAVHIWSRVWH